MRLKLTALMFGAFMGCLFLVTGLSAIDDLNVRNWIALILFSGASGTLLGYLYVPINRYLHKHGLSLHDDEDFDE